MTMIFNGQIDANMIDLPMQAVAAVRATTERGSDIGRAEAEFLFLMDRTGQICGRGFVEAAVRAVRDHLVAGEASILEADVDWLIGMVGDRPTAFGSAVVFAVVRACDSAPPRLTELAMRAALGRCLLV